ncbi:cold-shock protein [Bacillus sp. Y1]|jgi:hypothetical protein|uniref:cold-shock protein n=1 Tax=Robertmurraya sp. TaxID=2837525 RepID=UPI000E6AEA37|nr:cold-shock protein [Bacillus sp. Y1]AYA76667.1 cold-shock protein [Bacillus sp. Y1]
MGFGRKNQEEVVKEETKVWVCSSESCKCWIRDNFKSTESPSCPLCHSEMKQSTKIVEVLNNPSKSY